jgi:hypothetical protein
MTLGLCPNSECAVSRWDEAYQAYRDKDYVKAVELFKTEAMAGNVEAQFYLGAMYEYGDGVTRNIEEAARFSPYSLTSDSQRLDRLLPFWAVMSRGLYFVTRSDSFKVEQMRSLKAVLPG